MQMFWEWENMGAKSRSNRIKILVSENTPAKNTNTNTFKSVWIYKFENLRISCVLNFDIQINIATCLQIDDANLKCALWTFKRELASVADLRFLRRGGPTPGGRGCASLLFGKMFDRKVALDPRFPLDPPLGIKKGCDFCCSRINVDKQRIPG